MSRKFPLGSCFRWIFHFSMLKVSVELPGLLWVYVFLLHISLDFHPEANVYLVTPSNSFSTLSNKDKKVALIQFGEDGALARSSEFMKACHNMNIIVKTTGGYESYFIGKSESPNETLSNITRALLMNPSHKKELWCFAYQYSIYESPSELRIDCVVMFLTSSIMEQDLYTNTSKYGV